MNNLTVINNALSSYSFFFIILTFGVKLKAQPCAVSQPKTIDLKVYIANFFQFSPIEAQKIWFNASDSKTYELDLDTEIHTSLNEKFAIKSKIDHRFRVLFVDSMEQVLWLQTADELLKYDLKKQETQAFDIGEWIDYFPTKDNIFFLGSDGIFVYQRVNKTFSTLYAKPNFATIGLCQNPSNGFIFLNPSTYIIEPTLKIQSCTDENFEVTTYFSQKINLKQIEHNKRENQAREIFKSLGDSFIYARETIEDGEGFWKATNKLVAFYEKKTKNFYIASITDDTPEQSFVTFSDTCNLYRYSSSLKKLFIFPKNYLRSQMKQFDKTRFDQEYKTYRLESNKYLWNTPDCSFRKFEKKYRTFKRKHIENAYNFQLKQKLEEEVVYFFERIFDAKQYPILLQTTKKVLDSGRFPKEFGNLQRQHILLLARSGAFLEAVEKYNLYAQRYKDTPILKWKMEKESFAVLQKTTNYWENLPKPSTADSILWLKADLLLKLKKECPFLRYDNVGFDSLEQLIKQYPNSPIVEHAQYQLLHRKTDILWGTEVIFYADSIARYQHFLLKYPKNCFQRKSTYCLYLSIKKHR